MTNLHEQWMREALKEAEYAAREEEIPVGAVIVYKNMIIGRGHNQVERLCDPTAHAEMLAITSAVSTLGQKFLTDCTMYVTLEPCTMCAGALVLARISHLIMGVPDEKAGACGSVFNITDGSKLNHKVDVRIGIMEPESRALLKNFFLKKKKKK